MVPEAATSAASLVGDSKAGNSSNPSKSKGLPAVIEFDRVAGQEIPARTDDANGLFKIAPKSPSDEGESKTVAVLPEPNGAKLSSALVEETTSPSLTASNGPAPVTAMVPLGEQLLSAVEAKDEEAVKAALVGRTASPSDLHPAFVLAASRGYDSILELLIEAKALDDPASGGDALVAAASGKCFTTVRLLLEAGVDRQGAKGQEALGIAREKNSQAIAHLLTSSSSTKSDRELISACCGQRLDLVREALAAGGRPNLAPQFEAMAWACHHANFAIMSALLDAMACPNSPNGLPLMTAIKASNVAMIQRLLSLGADPSPLSGWPLLSAISASTPEAVEAVLWAKPDLNVLNGEPLCLAIRLGRADIVSMLLFAGADSERGDRRAWSTAVQSGRQDIVDIISLAFSQKARAHEAFANACADGDAAVITGMIASRVDVNYMPGVPLLQAVSSGSFNAVSLLLSCGADPLALDKAAYYSAHTSCQTADRDSILSIMETNIVIAETRRSNIIDACKRGDVNAVRGLLKGRSYNIDEIDTSLLAQASGKGNLELVYLLLAHNASPDGQFGMPLHLAVQSQHFEVVRALIQSGAHPLRAYKVISVPEMNYTNKAIKAILYGACFSAGLLDS